MHIHILKFNREIHDTQFKPLCFSSISHTPTDSSRGIKREEAKKKWQNHGNEGKSVEIPDDGSCVEADHLSFIIEMLWQDGDVRCTKEMELKRMKVHRN